MKPKRTLLITFDFPPMITGIGTYLRDIWRYLPSQNYFILAPKINGSVIFDGNSGLNVFRYPDFLSFRAIREVVLLFYALFLILKKRINFIFCSVPVSMGLLGLIFKKIFNTGYAVFYYGGEFSKFKDNRILLLLIRMILKKSDFIICISEFSKAEVRFFGVSDDAIFKVTPGVDTLRFKPGIDCSRIRKELALENKKVLLTVARLVKRKGVDLVIDALAGIIKDLPGLVYLIVGSGEEEENLKKQAISLGLENYVIFLGSVREEDLPRYYNLCDVYIMPNTEIKDEDNVEGFGISFIEASACAKPVIGGLSGGVKDAVIDGETGILVDPRNRVMLIDAVSRLLLDKNYALSLGGKGRLRAEREFGLVGRAQQIERILEKRNA